MTIKFYDVSHYQGDFHPSGPTVAKATEGTGFTDARYATNKARTLAGGWPFCGYHFLSHNVDVKAQAAHAFSVIGKTPAMLDVESGTTGSPSLTEVVGFVRAYRSLGGVLNLIYLPHWYWQGHWGSPSLQPLKDLGLALISSNYTSYSDSGPGWNPYGGMTPAIWQFTSTPLDTNAFKGTAAELAALFAGTPAPISGDDMDQATFSKLLKGALTDESTGILQAISIRVAHDVAHRGEYTPMPGNTTAASLATRVDGLATEAGTAAGVSVDQATLRAALVGALKQLAAADDDPPAS